MKNRLGIMILTLICVGLVVALVWNGRNSADRRTADASRIEDYSNQMVKAGADLDRQRQVNTEIEDRLKKQDDALLNLTNTYLQTASDLQKTTASLKATQEQMAREVADREAKISQLASQNQALDQRASDLSSAITNLTSQIEETKRKLAASEGDKVFLEKELQRLMAEKADLEKKFNDLAVLRAQVSKLKEELSISRRLRWIREGLFSLGNQKGAEQLMRMSAASATNRPAKKRNYDLNVEVSADGSVKVIPPLTNNPAATNPPPAK